MMQEVLTFATVLIPVVTALVQLAKTTVNMPKRVVPIIGFLIGLIVGFAASPFTDLDTVLRLWSGGIAGLSATGLFEMVFNKHEGNTKE